MLDFVFTVDYEIAGDGSGGLRDLVFEPMERLRETFAKWRAPLVVFVEALELEKIAEWGADPAITDVERQLREVKRDGHEIALHLHPQWANARREAGRWNLDFNEYNLCTLPRGRIASVVGDAIGYLRRVLGEPSFSPVSFRAGNWLFQPTRVAASVLAEHGIRVDSSVFKGGLQRQYGLDYRPALRNGRYWRFEDDVNRPTADGAVIELPIHAEMVAPWRMATRRRITAGAGIRRARKPWTRLRDLARVRYPLKLDFCRMASEEMIGMAKRLLAEDDRNPGKYWPVVSIGHTKDPLDVEAIDRFLEFLRARNAGVNTLAGAASRTGGRVLGVGAQTI